MPGVFGGDYYGGPQTPSVSPPANDSGIDDATGAGGAVHEVRDRRTGKLLARKTITTREAPMKQLVRELEVIKTIKHPNIIRFYGAYMSPSSSEVKVVMELSPGKSLEAVGKRIKERGARVGEKVAGRLAEGVCTGIAALMISEPTSSSPSDITGSNLPPFEKTHSSRHQTFQCPSFPRGCRQTLRLRRFRRIDRVCSGHVHWHQSLHGCLYCSFRHVISASDMRLPCSPNVFQVSNIPSARMSGRQAYRSSSLCKTVFPSLVICLQLNS